MSAAEVLVSLRGRGVRVSLVGDDLRLGGTPDALTDDLIEQIRGLKPALRAEVRAAAVEARDPFLAWRLRNAEYLSESDRAQGYDALTLCVAHHRFLSYDEQQRGACSWCVPVDPAKEPEYWARHQGRLKQVGDAGP